MKILDMSAGKRAMWFDRNNPLVTFLDIRPEVLPTVVCDTRDIPEAVGDGYSLVFFDPPHVNLGANSNMSKQYGHHTTAEIRDIIAGSAKEAHRVSTENALMVFKWSDHDQPLDKVLSLMSPLWVPLAGQITTQRTAHACKTHWVILLRNSA